MLGDGVVQQRLSLFLVGLEMLTSGSMTGTR